MHGQTGKGILLVLLYLVVFGCAGISTVVTIATVVGLIIPLAIWGIPTAIIIIDSYKVGKTLASGKPVGKWSFFPSP